MAESFDLAIIGAGAAGLIAAEFALQLGARVALLESERIGGDCTWTGCVPSKSLMKAAAVAASVRSASRFGISVGEPVIDLARVRQYLRDCIEHIYAPTAPEALRAKGLTVKLGAARFVDPRTLQVGDERLQARRILLCTGALPRRPAVSGIDQVPCLTYREIFENDRLPASMVVIGGGPLGCEVAQCYQRLGARVTIVAPRLLPRAEEQASELLSQVFAREGLQHVRARAQSVLAEGGQVRVQTAAGEFAAELLLAAVGRAPNLRGLELERAGVRYSERGIEVNARLQTTARHIYAAGDVIGGPQFSHLAGWQGFLAVRNAILPGGGEVVPAAMPEVTYTVPEVAHVGLTEAKARERFGESVRTASLDLSRVDRAVSENDASGFIKLVANRSGRILGATLVAERAGEALAEVALAIASRLRLRDLAAAIHPYPTYNSAIQLLASHMATEGALAGLMGTLARRASRWSLGTGAIT
jgi:pyruvate/2-oxoglutarate dehydrogenase complex dihydrolipoamide dehydrogenase (E3) component